MGANSNLGLGCGAVLALAIVGNWIWRLFNSLGGGNVAAQAEKAAGGGIDDYATLCNLIAFFASITLLVCINRMPEEKEKVEKLGCIGLVVGYFIFHAFFMLCCILLVPLIPGTTFLNKQIESGLAYAVSGIRNNNKETVSDSTKETASSQAPESKPQSRETVSFATRIANFFAQSAAEPKTSGERPSPHAHASDAVQSWGRFLDAAKARVAGVDAEWKKEHPEGSIYVNFRSQDVKKSDSLIHPIIGEVVLSYRLDYGPNGMRDVEIKNLETSLAVFAALGRKYFEMGNRVKEKELLKQVEETEELLKRARQKSTRLAATYAASLKFGWSETDGAWKFVEGSDKTEASSVNGNDVGETVHLTKLTGTLKALFP